MQQLTEEREELHQSLPYMHFVAQQQTDRMVKYN